MAENTVAGCFTLAEGLIVHRLGFGAMQLTGGRSDGPAAFGPPRDRDAAIAVLREAVALRRRQ